MAREYDPRLTGAGGNNPWLMHSSMPRVQMYTNMLGQTLTVTGATPRRCMSMLEREYATTTFNIEMPCNGRILKIFPRYRISHGYGTIKENPEDYVLYEDTETGKIGVIVVPKFHSLHQLFGFQYVYTDAYRNLTPEKYVRKGTVFAHSPSVSPEGDRMYGRDANVVIASLPCTIEDGVLYSRSMARSMGIKTYSKRVFKCSRGSYMLKVHGDKVLPDIGETVGPDGLLGTVREPEPYMSVVNMSEKAIRRPTQFDRSQYVPPGSKVIDIKIQSDKLTKPMVPVGMADQLDTYRDSQDRFNGELLREYHQLKRKHNGRVPLTDELFKLLMDTLANTDDGRMTKNRVTRVHKMHPLEEYRITVIVEHEMEANITYKTADTFGGKGVVVAVWEDEDMPIDQWGNRADVVMDDIATLRRMIPGRMFEQFYNASARDLIERIKGSVGLTPKETDRSVIQRQFSANPEATRIGFETILDYYTIVNPKMGRVAREVCDPLEHLVEISTNGHYLDLSTERDTNELDVIRTIRAKYPPNLGPVRYKTHSGEFEWTKSNILVGSMYIILLDKIGYTWSAVSSAKRNHYGIVTKLNDLDKYSSAGKEGPIRIMGEDEVRLLCNTTGGWFVAHLLDMSNNPVVHRRICEQKVMVDKPFLLEEIINRDELPLGQSRPLQVVKHNLQCAGTEFTTGE